MKLPRLYAALSPNQRREVREEYVRLQGGRCQFCGEPLTGDPSEKVQNAEIRWRRFPPNFLRYPVHLHHSHDTGLTIGAVHARCNAYLFDYLDE